MKIQILGPPRSGTTCLYEALRDNINYSMGIFEPINPTWRYKVPISNYLEPEIKIHLDIVNNHQTNLIEKNVILDINSKDELNLCLNFYKNYLKSFDKVVLLYRKNIDDQALSTKVSMLTKNWHSPYKDIEVDYKELLPMLKFKNELIINLSKELKIPIFFYEDLYSNNIDYLNKFLNYHNIELTNPGAFYAKMNTKNKLKQL
jgi:hypothetical protein